MFAKNGGSFTGLIVTFTEEDAAKATSYVETIENSMLSVPVKFALGV